MDSIKQIDVENNKVVFISESNKRNGNNSNNNNSEQINDAVIDFAIIQMKELIENVKNLQATYQEVFNIPHFLPTKDIENKCDVLLELNNNTVPARKKGTTLFFGDSILSGFKESKLSQKRLIKVIPFAGTTIQDMRFFVVPHLKKKSDNIIIHVGINNTSRSSLNKMFHEIQILRSFLLKYLPSSTITISTPVLCVDKANANDINKDFTESNLDNIAHENIKE